MALRGSSRTRCFGTICGADGQCTDYQGHSLHSAGCSVAAGYSNSECGSNPLRGRHQSRGQTEEAASHWFESAAAAPWGGRAVNVPRDQRVPMGMRFVNGGRGTDVIDGALPMMNAVFGSKPTRSSVASYI